VLQACAHQFDLVEVNSTFYRLLLVSTARRWRDSVPKRFEFTVKASRVTLTRTVSRPP